MKPKSLYRSPGSLSRSPGRFWPSAFVWLVALLSLAAAALTLLSGCASVAAYEKEHLADPILALDAERGEEGREVKWLEAREGSTGGVGGAGGGCACN